MSPPFLAIEQPYSRSAIATENQKTKWRAELCRSYLCVLGAKLICWSYPFFLSPLSWYLLAVMDVVLRWGLPFSSSISSFLARAWFCYSRHLVAVVSSQVALCWHHHQMPSRGRAFFGFLSWCVISDHDHDHCIYSSYSPSRSEHRDSGVQLLLRRSAACWGWIYQQHDHSC